MSNEVIIDIKLVEKAASQGLKKLGSNIKSFEGKATASFQKVSQAWDFFKGVLAANVVMKAFNGIISTVSEASQSFLDLTESISEVNSILPETNKLTEKTIDTFLEFSSTFGGTASGQAKAFYQIVSAGITNTAQATEVLRASNTAAVAGLTDMTTSADALTSALATYGSKGEDVNSISDKLFATVKEGKTTFGAIASNIGKIAPIASAAGIKFSELTGTLAFLTKVGLSTDESATGLRATIASLIKPSVEAKKEFENLGISIDSQAIKQKGLSGIMAEVIEKTGGSTQAMGKLFPNIMALNTVLAISKGDFADFNRIIGEVENSTGATGKAFKEVSQSASFQLSLLGQKLENLAVKFMMGLEKPITKAIKFLNDFIDSLGIIQKTITDFRVWLIKNHDSLMAMAKALAIVTGALILYTTYIKSAAIMTALYKTAVIAYTYATKIAAIATVAFNLALKLTPWGLAIAGITAVAVGIAYLIKNWDIVSAKVKKFSSILLDYLITPLEWTAKKISDLVGLFNEDLANAIMNQVEKLKEYKDQLEANAERELEAAEESERLAGEKAEREAKSLMNELEGKKKLLDAEKNKNKKLVEIEKKKLKELRQTEIENEKKRQEEKLKNLDIEAEILKAETKINLEEKEKRKLAESLIDNKRFQFIKDHLGKTETLEMFHEAKRLNELGKFAEARLKIETAFRKAKKKFSEIEDKAAKKHQKKLEDYNFFGGEVIMKMDNIFNDKKVKAALRTNDRLVALQTSKHKSLAAIGKAAALVSITVETAKGAIAAYSSLAGIPIVGPVLGIAAAAALVAYGAEQYANVLGSFQQGGIVPGQKMTGDQVMIRANSGEMVLNKQQQSQLFNIARGDQSSPETTGNLDKLINAISNQPIVVEIDGREIASAVRTAQDEGFSLRSA